MRPGTSPGAVAALLICGMVMVSGCTDAPAPAPRPVAPPPSVPSSNRAVDPATAAACRDVRQVNRTYTERFTAQLRTAGTALDREDGPAAKAATATIQRTFAQWSAALRSQADGLADPALKILLSQYAGAVDATIARVGTAADLDRLYTFTEKELDVMANRVAEVCP